MRHFTMLVHLTYLVIYVHAEDRGSRHTNNWAVLVDTSRFWGNYRHVANTLSLYHSVKQMGIPDNQIIMMLGDQVPCNARNCIPGQTFNVRSEESQLNLYGKNVEVDYRGAEVSVDNLITVLTGRHQPNTPSSKKLDSDANSNVFVYLTGHGGEDFLKFQDFEEISSQDIADAIHEMHVKNRYHELFLMVDTCHAGSLFPAITSPNVVALGSSQPHEDSYAAHSDPELGVALIDKFTFSALEFLRSPSKSKNLDALFNAFDPKYLRATPMTRTDLFPRRPSETPISDFLGSVLEILPTPDEDAYPLDP